MKPIHLIPLVFPLTVFAHSGHPGPEAHGDLTHLAVGLIVAVPLLAGGALLVLRNRSKAAAEIKKETVDG